MLHAITFDRRKFDKPTSQRWLISHEYTPIKAAHITKGYIHYRIATAKKRGVYYSKRVTPFITFVFQN